MRDSLLVKWWLLWWRQNNESNCYDFCRFPLFPLVPSPVSPYALLPFRKTKLNKFPRKCYYRYNPSFRLFHWFVTVNQRSTQASFRFAKEPFTLTSVYFQTFPPPFYFNLNFKLILIKTWIPTFFLSLFQCYILKKLL